MWAALSVWRRICQAINYRTILIHLPFACTKEMYSVLPSRICSGLFKERIVHLWQKVHCIYWIILGTSRRLGQCADGCWYSFAIDITKISRFIFHTWNWRPFWNTHDKKKIDSGGPSGEEAGSNINNLQYWQIDKGVISSTWWKACVENVPNTYCLYSTLFSG